MTYGQSAPARARKAPLRPAAKARAAQSAPADPALELQQRLAVSQAALKTQNPNQIRIATENVIALALRQMAELRMVEGAYVASAELYRQSLAFEEVPKGHVDLGIALLHLNQPGDALKEAEGAIKLDAHDVEAWKLKGHAAMANGDYQNASEALAHALKLRGDVETAYSLAVCFLDLKQPDKARLVFDDMVTNYGDSGALHAMFGRAYRDAGDTAQATLQFHRAIELDPKTPHAYYFLALLLLSTNEWRATPASDRYLAKALELEPRDFLANYLSGLQASTDKRYQDAQRYLQTAAEINPLWPDPWLYLGLNAFDQSDYKTAEPLLRKAIELTGSDEARNNYQVRKAYIDLARILAESGRKEEAKQDFQKARDFQKKTLEVSQQTVADVMAQGGVSGMGGIMPLMPKDNSAASHYESSDPAAPLDPVALDHAELTPYEKQQATDEEKFLRSILSSSFNDLGASEAHDRRFVQALAHFQQAEKWNSEVPGLVRNLGMSAVRAENYPEAVRALSQQLSADPADRVARAMLGVSYFMTNAFDNATKTFAPLGEAVMGDPGVGYPWAESLAKTGDFRQAAVVLEHLQQQQLPADTLMLIGQTWSEVGDYQRAVSAYRQALEQKPSLPRAHYLSGLAEIRTERPAEAAAEFQEELKIDPQNADAEYNLGFAYLQQSQRDKAEAIFSKVVAEHPEHADAQYQLGKARLEEGNVKEAIVHLEAAVKLAPEKDYIHYQLQAAYRKDSRLQDADRELALYKEAKARNRAASSPQSHEQEQERAKQNP